MFLCLDLNKCVSYIKIYFQQKEKSTCTGHSTGHEIDTKINKTWLPALKKFGYDNIPYKQFI